MRQAFLGKKKPLTSKKDTQRHHLANVLEKSEG